MAKINNRDKTTMEFHPIHIEYDTIDGATIIPNKLIA